MFGKIPNIQFITGVGEDMVDKLKPCLSVGNQLGVALAFGKRIVKGIGGTLMK